MIPGFLSLLVSLKYLNLSNSGFSGSIPPVFGNFSSLQTLDVTSGFFGLKANHLEWIANLASLEYLAMDGVNLSSVGSDWVDSINKLPVLTELRLSGCGLSSFALSTTHINFTSLAHVDLSGNKFNSKLPDWILNVSSLISVDISYGSLQGRIPLGFGRMRNLKLLNLANNNNLTASCSQFFSESWEKLEVLNLGDNKLHGRLPASIGNITTLIDLTLSQNNVTGRIPSSIGDLTSLANLDLSNNHIDGSIPNTFGKLCKLSYLILTTNEMTESLPEFLKGAETCPSKSPLPVLKILDLSFNKLTGNLPSWLGQLKELLDLNLQYNALQGPIPVSFGTLGNLSELRLASNKLNGTLPESIGQLTKLFALDISANGLTGVITESHFLKLYKLWILILNGNSFTVNVSANWIPPFQVMFLDMGSCLLGPSFPNWIRTQKAVNFLDVSNASISGTIPDWLWDMSRNLRLLNVSYNHLKGPLPDPFNIDFSASVDLSNNLFHGLVPLPIADIGTYDISNNYFSGPIPTNIGKNMPSVIFLSLAGNKLTSTIPDSLGELSSLEVLDLSMNNNLMGIIPSTLGNCSQLQALDLRNNNLSGVIPDSLGNLNLLLTLHLSNNQLSGKIPQSFRNLSSLETLDLGNNKLSGNIPQWIGEGFVHLRILSVRSKLMSGAIPTTISNLSSLQVLDLAENDLNSSIPPNIGSLRAMTQQQQGLDHYLFYGEHYTHYYGENLIVNVNGLYQKFTKTLILLTSIDLAGNNLHGEIPEGLAKLVGLEILNLSINNFNGQLPQRISELRQLVSLDLSNNRLQGPIPESIGSLSFLGHLNLSNNNFSGEVPYMNHMTTFEASSFADNPGLCGPPLSVRCPDDDDNSTHGRRYEDSGNGIGFIDKWVYMSISCGFAAGLLLPFAVIAVKRSWSIAYFDFVDRVTKRLPCMEI